MHNKMDLSHLDKKYFVDNTTYNCPFCKRNGVPYSIEEFSSFDWNNDKTCYSFLVKCSTCKKTSLHWTWTDIRRKITRQAANGPYVTSDDYNFNPEIEDLDEEFFFHQPTSFFTLDTRIPSSIRELILETESCRSANSLVGASACMRKAIYELLNYEKCIVKIDGQKNRADYENSVKKLKEKYNQVDKELFSILEQIQELSSDLIHEGSWKAWTSKELLNLTELLKIILQEIYLREDEKKKISKIVSGLKAELLKGKEEKTI